MKSLNTMAGNVKLWATISAILFLTCWFLPVIAGRSAASVWRNYLNHSFTSSIEEKLNQLGLAVAIFGIVSMVTGWVLQFPVRSVSAWFARGEKPIDAQPNTVGAL